MSDVQSADLTMQFVYDGAPPDSKLIEVDRDREFCGAVELTDESLIVDPRTGGIENVVVFVDTGRNGCKIPPTAPRNEEVQVKSQNCRIVPHIILTQVGDTLVVDLGADKVGHNLNFQFFRHSAVGAIIPANGVYRRGITISEPVPIPVMCNIHPWMKAYLIALDHPYVGISDAEGRLRLKSLPDNTELTFRVFHESLGAVDSVEVNGTRESWDRSRFTITTGTTGIDLGVVKVRPHETR